jgi:cellulose synthase/poly-beta-1,6-N-acetylglucosamine synthase-like glycosyltransferase
LLIYVIVGPLAWLAMLILLRYGRRRMVRLQQWRGGLPQPPPKVTILVPAKDEARGIGECIRSIFDQDYPDFDVIAINDRSADRTGAILDELARSYPGRMRVIHIASDGLPAGWLGKCNALYNGARETTAPWLFFVDSDVTLQRHALSHAVGISVARKYDALSIFTRLECHSFAERLVLPLAAGAWAVMHTVSLTNLDTRTNIAAANGQFFLIRRAAYEAVGGHESVRSEITEDVELMRLLKSRGFRIRLMLGRHLAATRMHSTLRQMFHGWGRIFGGTHRRNPSRILRAMAFLVICGFSVYPALLWGIGSAIEWRQFGWLIASLAHLLIMTFYLAVIYIGSGNHARYAWLFPLGGGALLAMLAFALRTCRTGRVLWRDTHFQMPVHAAKTER